MNLEKVAVRIQWEVNDMTDTTMLVKYYSVSEIVTTHCMCHFLSGL